MVLADAVKTFKETRGEPEGRVATGYSIRDKDDWDAIYSILESARGQYQRAKGPVGTLRRVRRKFADHSSPLAGAVKTASQIAPDSACTTPVLGAVELILDVRNRHLVYTFPRKSPDQFDVRTGHKDNCQGQE